MKRDLKARWVHKVCLVSLEALAPPARMARMAKRVLLDLLVFVVLQARKAPVVSVVLLAPLVPLGPLVFVGRQELKVLKASQVTSVFVETLVLKVPRATLDLRAVVANLELPV